jgi:hypothetical protein
VERLDTRSINAGKIRCVDVVIRRATLKTGAELRSVLTVCSMDTTRTVVHKLLSVITVAELGTPRTLVSRSNVTTRINKTMMVGN